MKPSATGTIAVHTELRDHREVRVELPADDRLEGAEALVADRLDEPSQVGALVRRTAEVDERERRDGRDREPIPRGSRCATRSRWPNSGRR